MASSYDLEGGNHPDHSHSTTSSPTPIQTPRWIDRYWKSNASKHALPTHQTPPTSFLRGPHREMQPRGQVILDTPPRPLPPPPPKKSTTGTYGLSMRASPPPKYDPNDLPPPERALLPVRPRPLMAEPCAPAQRIFIRPPAGQFPADKSSDEDGGFFGAIARRRDAGRLITITTDDKNNLDALELPLPDDDGDDSILHLPPPRRPNDPLNADGLDYEWPRLENVDREILGPERSLAWDIRRDDVETWYNLAAHNRVPMDLYLATTYGDVLPRLGREAVITARIFENRDRSRHGPIAGSRLYGPHRGRTHEEQLALEGTLETLAQQLGDRPDLEGGGDTPSTRSHLDFAIW
ncbi:hypothetical protein EV421DRAFT_1918156 [Armillaria borealis]|uniref:Uncharacterized protein n=1 Tax=Armillaria borealis TaxID=47425 RepID=A0AA39LY14_9AGAR|nr:hypothetical protein EV421DRAFT_1918156 [Armillaria borealis]